MFEGNLPRPAESRPLDDRAWDGDSLRPLRWDDLMARLSAARDLRVAGDPAEDGCDASFDAGSARWIAAHHGSQHSINPDDSSNGKGPEGTASGMVLGARTGATGN